LAEGLPTHWKAGTVAWGIALLFIHKSERVTFTRPISFLAAVR